MVTGRRLLWQESWSQQAPEWTDRKDVVQLIEASDYAARQLRRHPDIFALFESDIDWGHHDFAGALITLRAVQDETELRRVLRIVKHRYQTALIHSVLCKHMNQKDFLVALSRLAAALVDIALDWHYRNLVTRFGKPLDAAGEALRMVVFAMGKFGGRELNFSSDIDLIFAYRNAGETVSVTSGKTLDHERFFRRLAQKLIATLDTLTEEGFVYRVDMRLRPFGQSGPLALSFDALETYYQLHGRDWERYAMMKARPVAGDIPGGQALLKELRPFIYRRYLDYSALNSIAAMKHEINRQIRRGGMENHLKLGRGGIREAEFSVQAMQMIYGGQYPPLQSPHFFDALARLAQLQLWEDPQATALGEAYLLLRTVENALQFDQEQQTHRLPEHPGDWQRLALASGFDSREALTEALNAARATIHRTFCRIVADENTMTEERENAFAALDWKQAETERIRSAWLQEGISETEADALSERVRIFAAALPWQRLPANTLERLEKLLPMLCATAAREQASAAALGGVLELIHKVSGRSVYISMLSEQPRLIRHLLAIGRDSSWLIQFISTHPLVLDDVLGERENVTDPDLLEADLRARLQGLDEEQWLHALRDFKHAQLFKVAWADVHCKLSLMQVSDNLSMIAELVLYHSYEKAYTLLSERYGIPRAADAGKAHFAIIGYGKLGGLELGYGSDLDLVFLYDDQDAQGTTDGKRPIPNQMFFTRLAQRISNYLSAPSMSGVLYAVDTRLRPGGKSGLLVSSLDAFRTYQHKQAWVWEHQALIRARHVLGDNALSKSFEALRREVLMRAPPDDLCEQVLKMRAKMRENAPHRDPAQFDLKQSEGGLIDIEFMVQYLVLKHANKEPVLVRMSDNIRQLAALEATGILASIDAMTLRDAYRRLRGAAHRAFLNQRDVTFPAASWQDLREDIQRIWRRIFTSEG